MTSVDDRRRRALSRIPVPRAAPGRMLEPAVLVSSARFMTSIGFYLAIPFVTFYVTTQQGMTATQAGILLGVLNLSRRGFGIPAGWLADRAGAVAVLVGGMAVEALAYVGFMVAGSFAVWCVAVAAHGAGGASNNLGTRVILADARRHGRAINMSRYYVVVNLAALIGPLLGDIFAQTHTERWAFAAAAVLHAGVGGVLYVRLRALRAVRAADDRRRVPMSTVARDRELWLYCAGLVGCWFAVSELYVLVPLDVARADLPPSTIGVLTALNAAIAAVVIWRMSRRIASFDQRSQLTMLTLGAGTLAVAWAIPAAGGGLVALTAAVVVLSLGECFFASVVDVLVADLAGGPAAIGTYLGFTTMAWGIGAALGSALGGLGFGAAAHHGVPAGFWLLICVPPALSCASLVVGRPALLRALIDRAPPAGEPA